MTLIMRGKNRKLNKYLFFYYHRLFFWSGRKQSYQRVGHALNSRKATWRASFVSTSVPVHVLQLLHADAVVSGADEPVPVLRDAVRRRTEQDHHVRDRFLVQGDTRGDDGKVQRHDQRVRLRQHRHHRHRLHTHQPDRTSVRQQTGAQVFPRFENNAETRIVVRETRCPQDTTAVR